MARFIELYRNGKNNSVIGANGSETFGVDTRDYEGKRKYGSFNKLVILNNGTSKFRVRFDGQTDRQWDVPSTGSFTVNPEEGFFFDFVEVIDTAGAGIGADEFTVSWAKSQPVGD